MYKTSHCSILLVSTTLNSENTLSHCILIFTLEIASKTSSLVNPSKNATVLSKICGNPST